MGNHLPGRMQLSRSRPLLIGECGFGFGLNFLLTCEHFCRLAPVDARLHYFGCDLHPVRVSDLERFYRTLPLSLQPFAMDLLVKYPAQVGGLHRIHFRHDRRNMTLDLVHEEAVRALSSVDLPAPGVDAWYLDGFAPGRNQAMWRTGLCKALAVRSHPNTTLATYSVAGSVRRNLEAAGFHVSKAPGFGTKRQMLTGTLSATPASGFTRTLAWDNPRPRVGQQTRTVAIIGAGLAGCATAHALAARGLDVTLVEKNPAIAQASSGNPRGIVHFNPALRMNPAARFRLQAYTYALRHYQDLSRRQEFDWQPSGVIQLGVTAKESSHQQTVVDSGLYCHELLRLVTAGEVSELAGPGFYLPGLYLPQGGSLSPPALCQAWVAGAGITLLTGCEATGLEWIDRHWQVKITSHEKSESREFDAVVICKNGGAGQLGLLPDYPLIATHGQVDTYELPDGAYRPGRILCHQGYIVPWRDGDTARVSIGGSFAEGAHDTSCSPALNAGNLALVRKFAPDFHADLTRTGQWIAGRTGTRITTPDYLPLAGPVENTQACREVFAGYRRNARKAVPASGEYLPGLYINTAHGSSGLITTPLLGEYIAALVCEEHLPLLRDDIQAIHPLRYLIRDLKKQKTG